MIGKFENGNLNDPGSMKYRLFLFLILLILVLPGLWKCANPVAPEGGPKDVTPPRILSTTPPNYSTGFKSDLIKIEFNEFFALKNAASELNFSPPVKDAPDLRTRGKSLVIKLNDSLKANTTYSIDFGKSIADITENNVLSGYNYVFSTGSYLDSLSIRGIVVSAFDLSPQKDVFVMLYIDQHDTVPFDSLPVKMKPWYVTKTNDKGEFRLDNLRPGQMKLVALNDQNSNLIFDQQSEKVAFYDSLVRPYFIYKIQHDTSAKDSSGMKVVRGDTIRSKKTDTILPGLSEQENDSAQILKHEFPYFPLYLFEDMDSIQRISKCIVSRKGMVLITFRFPAKEIQLEQLNTDSLKTGIIPEFSGRRDSLMLWLTDPVKDSLILRICQHGKTLDTLKIEIKPAEEKSPGRNKEPKKVSLGIISNTVAGMFDQFNSRLSLTFSYPLTKANLNRIRIIQDKDSVCPHSSFADSLKRSLIIGEKWKEDKNYTLFIPDSVFRAINGLANDTLRINFKTRQMREYGNLILDLDLSKKPGTYIVQLLNDRDVVLREQFIPASRKTKFEYLMPGKYKIKAILDLNANHKWDTGNFRKKLQPEPVFYFPKVIEIRANWDVEEKWSPLPAY